MSDQYLNWNNYILNFSERSMLCMGVTNVLIGIVIFGTLARGRCFARERPLFKLEMNIEMFDK